MNRKPPRKPKPFVIDDETYAEIDYNMFRFKKGVEYFVSVSWSKLTGKGAADFSRWLEKAAEYVEYKNRG